MKVRFEIALLGFLLIKYGENDTTKNFTLKSFLQKNNFRRKPFSEPQL